MLISMVLCNACPGFDLSESGQATGEPWATHPPTTRNRRVLDRLSTSCFTRGWSGGKESATAGVRNGGQLAYRSKVCRGNGLLGRSRTPQDQRRRLAGRQSMGKSTG